MKEAEEKYLEALGQLGGALEATALRERPDMADLLRKVKAAQAACFLNMAACAAKARQRGGSLSCAATR